MMQLQLTLLQLLLFVSCSNADMQINSQAKQANVTKVSVSGSENSYTFSVTIASPDTGCEQYADWWEVVSESGELIYRRILLHSHVNEQPFTRSGGSIAVSKDQAVWIRAHMNNSGYGGEAMRGSVESGFIKSQFPEGFGDELDKVDPLPDGCNF